MSRFVIIIDTERSHDDDDLIVNRTFGSLDQAYEYTKKYLGAKRSYSIHALTKPALARKAS